MQVRLGNPQPREQIEVPVIVDGHPVLDADGRGVQTELRYFPIVLPEGQSEAVTSVGPYPDDVSLGEALATITLADAIWERHSSAAGPSWVSSDSDLLASLIADHYGCPTAPWVA